MTRNDPKAARGSADRAGVPEGGATDSSARGAADGKRCPVCHLWSCFCRTEREIELDDQRHHDRY